MSNLNSLSMTAGAVSSTGTISTIDNTIAAAGSPSANVQTVQGISGMTPVTVAGSVTASGTVTANAGTNLNTSALALETGGNLATCATKLSALVTGVVLAAGSAIAGLFKITDGTNTAAVKAASTAPVATDPALVVALSPNSVNANGRTTPANSAPVVLAKQSYQDVAASTGPTALSGGGGGATGDYLDSILVVPETTAAGSVKLRDSSGGTDVILWEGGGTTALLTLIPFTINLGCVSAAGAWEVTTGANVHVRAVGNFT